MPKMNRIRGTRMDTAITGASGHIGGVLVREILGQGRTARVLARSDRRALEGLDAEIVDGDVTDPDSLMELFDGVHTVFHLAAKISILGPEGGSVEKINVEGTKNVIAACLRRGVRRLIHFSSIHAFSSRPAGGVIDETRALATGAGEFCYDRSKAVSQKMVMDASREGFDTVVLNPTAVVGPYDFKPSRMGETILDIYSNRYPILVDGGYNWVDVRDVVSCALAAEEKGAPGECYLVGGDWMAICDVARMVSRLTGKKTPTFPAPVWLLTIPAYCALALSKVTAMTPRLTPYALHTIRSHRLISHEKAERELGYRPRPLEKTILDTLEWFRGQGILENRNGR